MMESDPPSQGSLSAQDQPVHISLRTEIQQLRRKIVQLETAEADNEKFRKELTRVKVQMHEERSQIELDFMNQISEVATENALKLEKMKASLEESTNANKILSDELEKVGGPDGVERKLQEAEALHKKEIAYIVERKMEQVEQAQEELRRSEISREELQSELAKVSAELRAEQRKVEELTSLQLEKSQETNSELRSQLPVLTNEQNDPQSQDVQILREKLRARDEELNSKIDEIRTLETDLKELKSHSVVIDGLEKENRGLKRDLESLNSVSTEKDMTIARLRTENRDLKRSLERVELENKGMKGTLQESSKSNKIDTDTTIRRLERENLELRQSMNKLENDYKELDAARQNETSSWIASQRNKDSDENNGCYPEESAGNRTSEIIKQLESNFKREGQLKHDVTAAMKSRTNNDKANEFKINSLTAEVNFLSQKLEEEREGTKRLRQENLTLKNGSASRDRITRPSLQSVNKSGGVKDINMILPPRRSGDDTETRPAVRGIVDSIELKIWRNQSDSSSIRRLMDRLDDFPDLAEDLEVLNDELEFERQQVLELEDELTRQCEINCTLLKEISNLTWDNEASRKCQSETYGILNPQNYDDDQKEIDRLMMEVADIKSKLYSTEQAKSRMQEEQNLKIEKYKKQIDSLKEQLSTSQKAADSIRLRMEESSVLDKQEIDRLLIKVDDLQRKLDTTESTLMKVEEAKSSREKDWDVRLNTMRFDFERSQKDDQATIHRHKSRISELEGEMSKAKDLNMEYKSKSRQQIESLNSMVEVLQANVVNAEASRDSLATDKENLAAEVTRITARHGLAEDRVKNLQRQIDNLRKNFDDKVAASTKTHSDDQEHIQRLKEQVKSLERELSKTVEIVEDLQKCLQEKEVMEDEVDALARKNVQALQAQINKLQKDVTKRQIEEAENQKKLSTMEERIDSVRLEMNVSLEEREKQLTSLRVDIEEREGKIRRLESEKEQLVLSMNDMMKSRRGEIDELQGELMEMSTRTANQTREVQTLKIQLEESSYRKDEMDRLRAKVTDLVDQLASRKQSPAHHESDTSTLEMEVSTLREKLRQATTERQVAEDKLREYVADKGGTSKSVQILRERNAALKNEVEKLTKKLRKVVSDKRLSDSSQHQRQQQQQQQQVLEPTTTSVESTRFAI